VPIRKGMSPGTGPMNLGRMGPMGLIFLSELWPLRDWKSAMAPMAVFQANIFNNNSINQGGHINHLKMEATRYLAKLPCSKVPFSRVLFILVPFHKISTSNSPTPHPPGERDRTLGLGTCWAIGQGHRPKMHEYK
jgi:hypothetical protein